MPDLDISASADEVVRLLQAGQSREAAARLTALRQDQGTAVQEALDRYVAQRGAEQLQTLRRPNGVPAADAETVTPMLERLGRATEAPRFPTEAETRDLPQAQQYDVYASIIATRGTQAARDALDSNDRVILGMRNESRTTENRGQGEYDDRIAVVWREADGTRRARQFNQTTTEPTAQYDEHAGTTPRRAPYGDVRYRRPDGEDANNDRVADAGRLAQGTVEMFTADHPRNLGGGRTVNEFALRPTPEAIANGRGQVERDTNADGWFDSRDVNGVQNLNRTFKIHRGSNNNTDSAGCQTIGGGEYDTFVQTVRGTPGQDRWQYVLTSTTPGEARQQAPTTPDPAGNDPRNPAHADHRMLGQIQNQLRELGGDYARNADRYGLALLNDAKRGGLTSVDDIALSNATPGRAQGASIFLVQGAAGDPASQRVAANGAEVRQATEAQSLERLQAQTASRETPTPAAPPLPDPTRQPVPEAPALRGP